MPSLRLLAVVICLSLTACGQTGDLYLPDEKPKAPPADEVPVSVTPTEPATDATPAATEPATDATPDATPDAAPAEDRDAPKKAAPLSTPSP